MIVGLAMQSVMGPLNLFENKFAKAILLGGSFKAGDTPKSRKFFGEKYREELTKDDQVVDSEGNVIVLKKDGGGATTTAAAASATGKKKDSKSNFEDLLLDTWDEGEKANVQPLLDALNATNADFKTSENGWTPLMVVCALGAAKCDAVIQKLKEFGANASIVDVEGWNALHWSAFHGSASGAKCLLEVYGVSAGLQDVKDKEGKTPLQHAKDEGNDQVVKIIEEMCGSTAGDDDKGLADKDGIRKRK
jgi:FOG: Ankyrin repeat